MKRIFINMFFRNPDPNGGGGGGTPEAQLLAKINSQMVTELEKRGYQNAEAVTAIMNKALEGLKLEALRAFDPEKVNDSLKKIAGELEKVQQRGAAGNGGQQKSTILRDLVEKNMEAIRTALADSANREVVLNTRAAVIMTTANVADETAVPDDILESFSIEPFVKKRRPRQYIMDIASRRTVAKITEYKTWLSEGDEEGAFALVTQGAVKPLVSKGLVRNVSKYKKVAGKYIITEETEKFRQNILSIIEDLINDKLIRDYMAILTANLVAAAASYVGTVLDGQYVKPTDYHAIGAVAAQIESLDFYPNVLILNPQDKWRIGLEQTDTGAFFVNIPMYNPSGEVTMMGFQVFTSNYLEAGEAILGEAGLWKIEDEAITFRIGYGIEVTKNGEGLVTDVTSDVDTNRKRIIAETFFHNWIDSNHEGSFVKFNFADVKEALTSPGPL